MPRERQRITYYTETVLECASGKREARVSDLSTGGCYIDSIANVQEGEKVSFQILVEPGIKLTLNGEVAYQLRGNGFGVKFVGLGETEIDLIGRIIKSTGVDPRQGDSKET